MFYRALLVCLATLGSVAHHRGHGGEPKEPGVLLSSKIATDGGFLTLPVKVGDQWRTFIVDTGTAVTTFDAPLVRDLPKADEAMKAMRAQRLKEVIPDLYVAPKIIVRGTTAGEIEFPSECAVASTDLSVVRASSRQPIDGVLGMDFLVRYAIELDLAAGTLRLLDSQQLPVSKHDAILDVEMIDLRPCSHVVLGDVKSMVLLDTGALATLYIERNLFHHLADQGQLHRWLLEAEERDGKEERLFATSLGWLHGLQVGPFTHYCLAAHAGDKDSANLLGLFYWRRYRCIFDFPKRQVYLDKGPLFDVFDDTHHAGMFFTKEENKLIVADIVKGSWVEDEVRVGDQLIQIDGKGVESETRLTLYNRLAFHHDRTCELRLVRDGKEFTVVLPASGLQPRLKDDGKTLIKEDGGF